MKRELLIFTSDKTIFLKDPRGSPENPLERWFPKLFTHGNHLGNAKKKSPKTNQKTHNKTPQKAKTTRCLSLTPKDWDLIGPAGVLFFLIWDKINQKISVCTAYSKYCFVKPCFRVYDMNLSNGSEVKSVCYRWTWSKKFESCPELPRIASIGLKGELPCLSLEYVT